MPEFVKQEDYARAIEDLRMEQGLVHQAMREDWQRELGQILKGFKNEMRLLIAVAVLVLKFQVPSSITAAALGLFAVKAAVGFVLGRH